MTTLVCEGMVVSRHSNTYTGRGAAWSVALVLIAVAVVIIVRVWGSPDRAVTGSQYIAPAYNQSSQNFSIVCVGGEGNRTPPSTMTYSSEVTNGIVGPWNSTAGNVMLLGAACADYNKTAYCVGGAGSDGATSFNTTRYASLSTTSGLWWNFSSPYPYKIKYEGCTTGSGNIYCVGGIKEVGSFSAAAFSMVNLTYYAVLSANGIGQWTESFPYPNNVVQPTCAYYNSTVYCLQGYNLGSPPYLSGATNYGQVYYSHVVANSTLTHWIFAGNYPAMRTIAVSYPNDTYHNTTLGIVLSSCNAYSGYLYCVGGASGIYSVNRTYYARILTNGGLGQFVNTTSYPVDISRTSCVIGDGIIYCIGGMTNTGVIPTIYSASLSSSGISAWSESSNGLPVPLYGMSCFATS